VFGVDSFEQQYNDCKYKDVQSNKEALRDTPFAHHAPSLITSKTQTIFLKYFQLQSNDFEPIFIQEVRKGCQ
jgi:hypothetical protein